MKWVSMVKQLHTSLRSPCTIASIGWSGVKLAATGLWSSRNAFSGVMNHTSPSGSPMDESVYDGCQENATRMHSATKQHSALNNKFGGRGIMVGLFFMVQARPLSSSEGTS
jgi:hypothetical protein